MHVGASVVLPVTPAGAWSLLTRWEHQARWIRDAAVVEVVTAAREGVGVRVKVKTRILGVPLLSEELEVRIWDPPRRLVMAHRGLVRGVGIWALEPRGLGTGFTWIENLSLPVPILGELSLAAYRPVMRHLMRGSLRDLRAFVLAT